MGSVVDLEHAVNEFRSEFRQVWRRRGLTPEQTQEIVAIRTDAGSRIRAVVARR